MPDPPYENIIDVTNLSAVDECRPPNCSSTGAYNFTQDELALLKFEAVVQVVVPIIFGIIALLGISGNLLVMIVVISNKQMRNTTNLLIINLAIADLFFIIICVPFTTTAYAMHLWPFGDIWCKIYQYMINVTAYASVYTLVLMSLDRYLAVVHPISSMSIRTVRNANIVIGISWALILFLNFPILLEHYTYAYTYLNEDRSACLNIKTVKVPRHGKVFYGCFFAFAYCIPLTTVCVLYGFMLKRLLYGVVPRGNQSAESIRSKKRVTRMVIIVVAIFAMCWLPLHLVFLVRYFSTYPDTTAFVAIQITSNCLAYMNSCVNPILYAFLSENFRKSFRKLLCGKEVQHTRMEFERTNTNGLERANHTSKTYTCAAQLTSNETGENGL